MVGMGDSNGDSTDSADEEAVATARRKCRERAEELRRQARHLDNLAQELQEMRGEVGVLERTHNLTPVVDEHLDMAEAGVAADAREMREEADKLDEAAEVI